MKKFTLFFTLLVLAFAVKAQVKGTVVDSASKKPIDKAVIGLVVKDKPADTSYTFTNEKGEFAFDVVPSSNFSVIITNSGFAPVAKFVPVKQPEKTISIGTVILAARAKLLDEITVVSAPIVIKEDTVEYRADAFKTKEGAVVEDLLKKLPGIQVDKDGKVVAHGKEVTRVKVNGKDFFGGDVKTATKELPANIVDKIQVIDDYGDQATVSGIKDGEPDKVINIELKKDKNKGFFGRATVGGGTEERYQGSFNGNYFNNNTQISMFANSNNTNTSLFNFSGGGNRGMSSMIRMGTSAMGDMGGMSGASSMMQMGGSDFGSNNSGISATNSFGTNYRAQWSKRVNVYGSYSYSHRNTAKEQYTSRTITQNRNNEDLNSLSTSSSHRATFNIEYQIDSFNYLKVTPNVSYSGNDGNSKTLLDYKLLSGQQTLNGSNSTLSDSKAPNVGLSVLYNHKFRKRGRNFSATLNAGNSESNSSQNITNLSNTYFPFNSYRNTFQYIDQENTNYNYGVRFTYSEPINKFRTLDFSASHNLNYSRNNRQTFNVDSLTKYRTLNNILTNDYENDFYNNRVGVSMRTTMKKYNYTIGISAQPVDLRGKSLTKDSAYKPITRVNIFPIARLAYNFSRSKALNMSYNGTANQPGFSQLQPVADSSNPQSVVYGNPGLKPAINHNINLSFNNFNFINGKVFFSNLTFTTVKNQIVNSTVLDVVGKQTSTPENVNGYYNVMGFYTFSKPYKNRRYVITFNGTANYNHNVNMFNNSRIIGQNWVLSQGFVFEFNHKEWLELGAGVNYSLNDVHYKKPASASTSSLQNASSNAYTFTHYANVDVTKRLILKYDVDYTINNGLSSAISQNPVLINASLEQQLFKKKNGILKFAAYDLLKQNTNISRSVSGAAITDTRVNRLTRYFMLTFTYRLQKFAGQAMQGGGMRPGMGGGQIRMF
jgi:Outer membrane protein beta-barrel family/Carboxypeptidase regulatory-like domain